MQLLFFFAFGVLAEDQPIGAAIAVIDQDRAMHVVQLDGKAEMLEERLAPMRILVGHRAERCAGEDQVS
jgi:hypothetical protein